MDYKKEDYINAVDDLINSYDAYYFLNKYSELNEGTHGKQFEMLYDYLKDDEMCVRALKWIKNCYDCYYKEDVKDNKESAFYYLKNEINKKFGNKEVPNES